MAPRNRILYLVYFGILLCLAQPALAQGTQYAVLIGGLGGSEEYTNRFGQYLSETRRALVDNLGFEASNVIVLAEPALQGQNFVTDVSTAENIRARFQRLASTVRSDDHVYVILFGHGSFDGTRAQLNIPQRDLSDSDYADLVASLQAGRVVLVNTASASGPFVQSLSGPDRIVITATRSGNERNETVFPEYFVEALANPAADLNKDGSLTVQEVFVYAARNAAASFDAAGHLATEHALLEDTGDGKGFRVEELDQEGEGGLASVTYLKRSATIAHASSTAASASPEQARQREQLEREIAALKSRKASLGEDDYYAQLEALFVQLARLNDEIEASASRE
jgi:hypothetical protein